MKCANCGAELTDDSKFCSYCGNKIEVDIPQESESEIPDIPYEEPVKSNPVPNAAPKSAKEKIEEKGQAFWRNLSLYGKVTTVSVAIFVILLFVALLADKATAIVIAIVQIVMAIVSGLMHKGIIKLEQKKLWLKWLILAIAILFTVLNVMSYSWGTKTPPTGHTPSSTTQNSDDTAEQIDWANITLSKVLPEPQSNMMDLLYNGDDWLNVTVHGISENDFLEYVRWCKEDYGFTIDSDSFDDYFYAYNKDGYCVTLFYTETSKELNIDLSVPEDVAENLDDSTESQQPEQSEKPEQAELPKTDTGDVLFITKGTEYAYMTDEWNVYIATAISDEIIKIANWDKTMSNSKRVEHDYDVGTFKINDSSNGFAWVDDEHTTFVLTFTDKNNSKFKKGGTATFTINISDSDKNKGSNYSEDIACFSYQNDDWHLYRAIPLTETLIKIETWYRGSSAGTFLFGYDLCLIDTTSGDTDFEWTDDEHTSFSITMRDEENKYEWKQETFVVFILENEDYTHFDVKSYLGKWEVGDGEVAVPASASDYKYDNYQNVQKDLEDAGFTNIATEILYDIIWGWTEEGEVKSVSINGRTDYEKGEVFNQDAPIVITYHMPEEDDPSRISMPDNSTSYVGKDYKDVEKAFKDLGFTNVVVESSTTSDASYADGEVYSVKADYETFEKGNTYAPDDKITIRYYIVEEVVADEPVESETTTPTPEETEKPTEPGEPESEYEKAYIRDMSNYDLYYMFDTDTKTVVYFGTNDTYIERGTYTGDFSTGVTITWSHGEWTEKFTHKSGNYATLIDGSGWDWEYKVCDVGAAQRILDSLQ